MRGSIRSTSYHCRFSGADNVGGLQILREADFQSLRKAGNILRQLGNAKPDTLALNDYMRKSVSKSLLLSNGRSYRRLPTCFAQRNHHIYVVVHTEQIILMPAKQLECDPFTYGFK